MTARCLSTKYVEKPWGRDALPALFPDGGNRRIGEVWFDGPEGEHPALLVKYIFTSERLSIRITEPESVVEPPSLRRASDGQSVFRVHGGERYTTSEVLIAEESLLAAAVAHAEVVDPTGAGDAFAAGFLAEWVRTSDPIAAAMCGVLVGARAVETIGGRPPRP